MTKDVWPAPGQPFTSEILDRLSDDGRRYELLTGCLIVSPRPSMPHQLVVSELSCLLMQARPAELAVIHSTPLRPAPDTELVLDIAVVRQGQMAGSACTTPPMLAVEVCSPATALIDLHLKRAAYEYLGVPSYWIVIPDPAAPEVIAFTWRDGRYTETAHVTGSTPFLARQPFAVTIVPADLVAGLASPD